MSDDHPAIMFVNFFHDKINNIDICWLNNGNTHPPGLYAGEAPDEKLRIGA